MSCQRRSKWFCFALCYTWLLGWGEDGRMGGAFEARVRSGNFEG